MLGWIYEKMATEEFALKGGKLFAFGSTITRNGASVCNGQRPDQLGGWGHTLSKFSPHNVDCRKGER